MMKRKIHVRRIAGDKTIRFRWDGEGGCHVHHTDALDLSDLKRAWCTLGLVIAHNDYLNGAMPHVHETFRIMEESAAQYLEDLVLDELVPGTRVEPVEGG